MTQPDIGAIKDLAGNPAIVSWSVLSGGSSDPKTVMSDRNWAQLYAECQTQAHENPARDSDPLRHRNALHGHNNVLGAVIFPHNIGLGCTEIRRWSKKLRA